MKKYNKIDLATLKNIHKELEEVLQKYADQTGLEFSFGRFKFFDVSFKVELSAKISGEKTIDDELLESALKVYNLSKIGSDNRVLKAYNPKNYKNPFLFTQNGKNYKCCLESAKVYFKKVI